MKRGVESSRLALPLPSGEVALPARVRAHVFSLILAPSPDARRLTSTSPEGRGKQDQDFFGGDAISIAPLNCILVAELDHVLRGEEGAVDGAHVDEHAVVVIFVAR